MAERKYRIKKYRWENACLDGFVVSEQDGIVTELSESGKYTGPYFAFLKPIDSGTEDSTWGRLSLKCRHGGDAAGFTYVFSTNEEYFDYAKQGPRIEEYFLDPEVSSAEKLRTLTDIGAERFANSEDILLYSQKGRYLYLAFEAVGSTEVSFYDGCVYSVGDTFMATFPEVYREGKSFFHRWMSVFSTVYYDIQDEIDNLPKLLDPDTCPEELLPVYASWMGFDISGGFLPVDVCRNLVKEGYELSKRKGTRYALSRIIEIVLGCEADVLEHNTMRGYLLSDGAELPPNLRGGGVYDVTILVHGEIKEIIRHRLMFLLDQFKPVRARLHLVELNRNATMDGNAYLDMNAAIPVGQAPTLDSDSSMGTVLTLT